MTVGTTQEQSVIPASHADLLESTALAHVATVGPTGEPQVNPVWFGVQDGRILFSQTKTRQKVRNLRREPRIALSIVDPENPYRYLEVRGVVERVEDDPDNDFMIPWLRSTSAPTAIPGTARATSAWSSSSARSTPPAWANRPAPPRLVPRREASSSE